jgi:hypothetical protein
MMRRFLPPLVAGLLAVGFWCGSAAVARAQGPGPGPTGTPFNRYYYYPFYYFPHNYWPTMSPPWPGPPTPYASSYRPMVAPAYMAYPPFTEPTWRYEFFSPQPYHRGFHFWLDQM